MGLRGDAVAMLAAPFLDERLLVGDRPLLPVGAAAGVTNRRVTTMPRAVVPSVSAHLQRVQSIHAQDLADGFGRVEWPHALARNYPNASREWIWQYVFPQEHRWVNARTGDQGRNFLSLNSVAIRFTRMGSHCDENGLDSNRSLDPIRWLVHDNSVLLRPSADMARSEPGLHINANRRNSRRIATPTRERACTGLVADLARFYYATMHIHLGADLYRRLLRWDSVLFQHTWRSLIDARVGAPDAWLPQPIIIVKAGVKR